MTKAFLHASGKLWREECTELRKDLEDALIPSEDIPQYPSETLPTFFLKNEHAPLNFFYKAKHRKQNEEKNEIMKSALPFRLSYYIYLILKVKTRFSQVFVSESCPSLWCYTHILNCGALTKKPIGFLCFVTGVAVVHLKRTLFFFNVLQMSSHEKLVLFFWCLRLFMRQTKTYLM